MFDNKKLIQLVKNHRILYDVSHEDYKNIRKKDDIWDEIGSELKESGEETKKRWRNLRDSYSKFLRATKTRKGKAASKKKWIWAEYMTAFRPYLGFTTTSFNVSPIVTKSVYAERDEDYKSVAELAETEGSVPTTSHKLSNGASPADCNLTSNAENFRKRSSASSNSVGELIKYFENKKQKAEPDAIDSLFLAHAQTLKTFSKNGQIITKMKIAQIMMEQELLEEDNNPNFSFI